MKTKKPVTGPHELDKLEVREQFIRWIWDNIKTWEKEDCVTSALQGAFGSLLGALDGANMGLPGFLLVPDPKTGGDSEWGQQNGENWYKKLPDGVEKKLCDISGSLRDEFYAIGDKEGYFKE